MRPYLDLRFNKECDSSFLKLNGIISEQNIDSQNGEKWHISFKTVNSKWYYIALWSARILILTLLFLLAKIHTERLNRKTELILIKLNHNIQLNNIATQVAHDIKSPLAALEIVMDDIRDLPEDSRELTLNAINRIQEIANNLSKENIEKSESLKPQASLISYTVKATLNEKSLELQSKPQLNLEFSDLTDHMSFVQVNSTEMSRLISNLINNSSQALNGHGTIKVELSITHSLLNIIISDNGPGFPKSMLDKEIQRGNTQGKEDGQGLGLHHAFETISKADGQFYFYNNNGAVIKIQLPLAKNPHWFRPKIEFTNYQKIFIIDDDRSIHDLWKRVLSPISQSDKIVHIQTEPDISSALRQASKNDLILIDYDLRQNKTGVDYISEYDLKNAVIVTSGHEQISLQEYCIENQLQLLPKFLIQYQG